MPEEDQWESPEDQEDAMADEAVIKEVNSFFIHKSSGNLASLTFYVNKV